MIKSINSSVQENFTSELQTTSSAKVLNTNNSDFNIENIQEGEAQTLSSITQLQIIEKEYFNNLEQGLAQGSLSVESKDALVQKINQISQMRVNLYKNLNGMYSFYKSNISEKHNTLSDQVVAIEILEGELNESKNRLKIVEEDKTNKLKLVEINAYYGERFNDYANIMKIIVYSCIPILILTFIKNRGFIPPNIYTILIVGILVFALIYLGYHLLRTYSRNSMKYQEYDWFFNISKAPTVDKNSSTIDPWAKIDVVCYGQNCCSNGEIYNSDPSINKCVAM